MVHLWPGLRSRPQLAQVAIAAATDLANVSNTTLSNLRARHSRAGELESRTLATGKLLCPVRLVGFGGVGAQVGKLWDLACKRLRHPAHAAIRPAISS